MFPQKLLQTIVKSLIWINCFIYFGSSLQIQKINDPFDVRIAKKLKKFLDGKTKHIIRLTHQNREQKEPIKENVVENNANTIEESYDLNDVKYKHQTSNGLNRILVKRIVPHGTYYKPLIRIHKNKKALNIYNKDNKHGISNNYLHFITSKNKRNKFNNFKPKSLKYYNEYFLQPFKYKSGKLYPKSSTEETEEMTELVNWKPQPDHNDDETLRSKFQKSGEHNDPLAPGKPFLNTNTETTTEKKKVWLPNYPPWNYWTYKKSIYQDECPGWQVAIGGMCIKTPPH